MIRIKLQYLKTLLGSLRKYISVKDLVNIIGRLKNISPHWYIFFVLLVLIPLFYWSLTTGFIIPAFDGALPISYYAHLYTGYLNFGRYFMLSPFSLSEDLISSSFFQGASSFDPILRIWFIISKLFDLSILKSFYFYLLVYIFLGSLGAYALGVRHFFESKGTAFYLAIIFAISGYFVSNTSIMHFILPFAWLPIILLIGFECFKYNRLGDYYLLALTSSILLADYTAISISVLLYAYLFLIPVFLFCFKKENLRKIVKNLIIFILLSIFFNSVVLSIYLRYLEGSIKWLYELKLFYFGNPQAITSSNNILDLQWIFNIFIPNDKLAQWSGYGNLSLWQNSFYYLGVSSLILTIIGIYILASRKHYIPIFISFIMTTLFSVIFSQGFPLPRLLAKVNTLIKYPHFSRPLVIFSFILASAYGVHYLFEKKHTLADREKSPLTYYLLGLPLTVIFAVGVFVIIRKVTIFENTDNQLYVYSLSYMIIFGLFYCAAVISRRKWVFILILIVDLFAFLSSSFPLVMSPNRRSEGDTAALYIENDKSFQMPKTINYSLSKGFTGMHFGMSPIYNRLSSLPAASRGFIANRRVVWTEKFLRDASSDVIQRYNALNLLGVTRKKYYFTDHVLVVEDYEDIYKNFMEINKTINSGQQSQNVDIAITSDTEPKIINIKGVSLNPKDDTLFFQGSTEEYISILPNYNDWDKVILPKEKIIDRGNGLYEYKGDLPALSGLVTEGNVAENICPVVSDGSGVYYYPLSDDIFNFEMPPPPDQPSNLEYMIFYQHFYATYLNENGKISLFLRAPIAPSSDITLTYRKDCDTNPQFNLPHKLTEDSIKLKSNDFEFLKDVNNKYAVFQTARLVDTTFPSYFGILFNRVIVHDNEDSVYDWYSESKKQDSSYEFENNIMRVIRSYYDDPYNSKSLTVEYTHLTREIYNKDEIEIVKETPDDFTLRSNTDISKVLIARVVYDPDWHVKVDGKKANITIINGIYMGVEVPQGEHLVEFKFQPFWITLMNNLMPVYSIIIPALIIFSRRRKAVS